jgi:hypothetical protein
MDTSRESRLALRQNGRAQMKGSFAHFAKKSGVRIFRTIRIVDKRAFWESELLKYGEFAPL